MKVDHEEQVSELFTTSKIAAKVKSEVDMQQKKLVYKLVSDARGIQNKVTISNIFKRYKEL